MVFVDDVATAVLLAAEHDAAVGEAFLVSGSGFRTRYLARILRRLRKNAWETKVVLLDDGIPAVRAG